MSCAFIFNEVVLKMAYRIQIVQIIVCTQVQRGESQYEVAVEFYKPTCVAWPMEQEQNLADFMDSLLLRSL